ncbi:hypothetical protein G4177_11265 [Corallococcus sp. ZKHCc1 1396]|uniref:Uncharacterized protein n=1 Tax=Corallococcus soli TaxID=2710757 RepID=A0ABR9PLD3_9BACT|nr:MULTISPECIES: hypothetical protein [Corallococcus]MBE4748741.1 hypothetical protein [Corallococcus soli]MCY1031378.1 hypothetical protein [Corallococcus sp. BB11-1]
MALLDVNYTWFGPPTFDARDSGGPKALMRARSDTQASGYVINFWCLDAHVWAYRNYFKGSNFSVHNREKLEVRGIETFLNKNVGVRRGTRSGLVQSGINWVWSSFSWDIDLVVKHIIETSMGASANSATRIREIVNAKNIWSLYTMYKVGGYAMDTGVGPGVGGAVSLRDYTTFKVPAAGPGHIEDAIAIAHAKAPHKYLSDRCSAMTAGVAGHFEVHRDQPAPHVDVWTLFSPAGHAKVTRALEWYCRFWYSLEEVKKKPNSTEEYKDLCRHGIISAVMTAITHDDNGRCLDGVDRNCLWPAELTGADAGVPELKTRKTYYGSHR